MGGMAILKLAKIVVNKSLDTPLSIDMGAKVDSFAMCFGTADQKEGSKAFLKKQTPKYTGR